MIWMLPRLLVVVAAVLVPGLLGLVVGKLLSAPLIGLGVGGLLGAAVWVLVDEWRAARLLRWLQTGQESPAPRGRGFWGELGYRTERALRQRELELTRERERRVQFLSGIEASPNGVVLLDAEDHIDWCNGVAADHLGLDAHRDLRQPVTNLLRAPAFVAYLKSGDWSEPITMSGPHAASLSVLIRGYGEGQKLVLTQDVTERLRTDAMRRDFVANVSHEIRTPLTVLHGFVETMRSLPLSEAERRRVLTLMTQQTERMQMLVTDLLTLAQLEGSSRPAVDRWHALAPLLGRVAADARTLSGGRHALALAEAVGVELAGSDTELLSALGNLVNNAVRYTPEGGSIVVSWQTRPDGGGQVEVRDSGIGIAREHLPRLTERFYRVDGSRSRETGGTGLGLAIVKHVMQRHGGALEIESELGQGSSFRLVFPAARVRPDGSARPMALAEQAG
jgi:two-component system, OmpR family, phosphate regulon sensor histidine kinase PhoR